MRSLEILACSSLLALLAFAGVGCAAASSPPWSGSTSSLTEDIVVVKGAPVVRHLKATGSFAPALDIVVEDAPSGVVFDVQTGTDAAHSYVHETADWMRDDVVVSAQAQDGLHVSSVLDANGMATVTFTTESASPITLPWFATVSVAAGTPAESGPFAAVVLTATK